MTRINTVLGPIDTSALGFTLMHEHLLVTSWALRQTFPAWIDRDAVVAEAVQMVHAAKDAGVQTLVDATPINLGRDVPLIREVAERAELPIIVATGFYHTEEPFFTGWNVDALVDLLRREVQEGVQGTDVKPGLIKCATSSRGVTEVNRKLLQVAARLHRATGLPLYTHSTAQVRNGLDQQDVFEAEGVDLARVVIGHSVDTDDLAYLETLLDRVSYLGMDRFFPDPIASRLGVLSTDRRVAAIAALCQRGYADQLVLSHDYNAHIDWFTPDVVTKLRQTPQAGFHYIPRVVLPALRTHGVTESQIVQMTTGNPKRFFDQHRAY